MLSENRTTRLYGALRVATTLNIARTAKETHMQPERFFPNYTHTLRVLLSTIWLIESKIVKIIKMQNANFENPILKKFKL